jgi:AraC-like DNA-binding protein
MEIPRIGARSTPAQQVRGLTVFSLGKGQEVEVRRDAHDDFVLVHIALEGSAFVTVDGARIRIASGQAALLSPRAGASMSWQGQAQQLTLKVPHLLLKKSGLCMARGELPAVQPMTPDLSKQWRLLVQSLVHSADFAPHGAALSRTRRRWLEHLERGAVMLLALHLQEHVVHEPAADAPAATVGDAGRLSMLKRYMESRLAAPITLEDLARAAGVSVRTLNELCRRQLGQPPMAILRDVRLDAVRATLAADPSASVTGVALDCGFGHLGRFAGYYRKRFGELPSRRPKMPWHVT